MTRKGPFMKATLRALLLLAALLLFPCAAPAQTPLRVEFFDVGKADAILITTPDARLVLIDAGTDKDGKRLAERLEAAGIDALDAMIITHFDKDHVGGADRILNALAVSRVVMPEYPKDGKQYEQFIDALSNSEGTQITRLSARESLELPLAKDGEDIALSITAAHEDDYGSGEENDFSLAIRLRYGQTRFLFPGDAEDTRQRELLAEGDVCCDVLKVPHHGRLHDASAAFLYEAWPAIAFVSDSAEEPANHALLSLLSELGTDVHRAKDGDLVVLSDGERVWVEE